VRSLGLQQKRHGRRVWSAPTRRRFAVRVQVARGQPTTKRRQAAALQKPAKFMLTGGYAHCIVPDDEYGCIVHRIASRLPSTCGPTASGQTRLRAKPAKDAMGPALPETAFACVACLARDLLLWRSLFRSGCTRSRPLGSACGSLARHRAAFRCSQQLTSPGGLPSKRRGVGADSGNPEPGLSREIKVN
jgi:hypothetical protein